MGQYEGDGMIHAAPAEKMVCHQNTYDSNSGLQVVGRRKDQIK